MQHIYQIIERMNGRVGEIRRGSDGVGDDDGNNLVEYTLLMALIVLVCFLAVSFLGNATSSQFSSAGGSVGL